MKTINKFILKRINCILLVLIICLPVLIFSAINNSIDKSPTCQYQKQLIKTCEAERK